ncbi:PhzF family phenazine biosynthesis protein [Streptomyces sp. 7R007]
MIEPRAVGSAEGGHDIDVTLVHACRRDGRGGSPTAVLDEVPMSDEQRRRVPVTVGASHAVFVSRNGAGPVSLRFFTAEGELPACGHGTVAALAVLAQRDGGAGGAGQAVYEVTLRTVAGELEGRATRGHEGFEAFFTTAPIGLRKPEGREHADVLTALGIDASTPGCVVATLGRPRLLVPLPTRSAVAALTPDTARLRAACDRLGLLGCYVHSAPTPEGRVAARMFAPSIGVPEDVANANSTACLAARLARRGVPRVTADMGDSLGNPATITAVARAGEQGTGVLVGGAAEIIRVLALGHA